MAQPTDYQYLHDKEADEWGYKIGYRINGINHSCKILSKPQKNNRRGVYQTRTDCDRAIYSFFGAKDDQEAGIVAQQMLEDMLAEIRKLE